MSTNKDWNGNGNSIFKTLGASNHTEKERETDDFYATDPVAIDLLCDYPYVELPQGVGAVVRQRLSERAVTAARLPRGKHRPRGPWLRNGGVNFFEQKEMPEGCTTIVTNPPYKYATEYVLHALRLLPTDGLLCLFLKTTFAEGKERYQRIFGVTPPALVLQCSERVLCAKNADFDGMIAGGGSAVSYAWWVWRKGWSGQTTLDWINHPSAQQAVQLELFM